VFSIDETFQDRFEDWSEQGGDTNIVTHGRVGQKGGNGDLKHDSQGAVDQHLGPPADSRVG
jgi:hypothetical protein